MPIAGTKLVVVKVRKPVDGKHPANWTVHGPKLLNSRTMKHPPRKVSDHINGHTAGYFFARWNSRDGSWSIGNPAPEQEW